MKINGTFTFDAIAQEPAATFATTEELCALQAYQDALTEWTLARPRRPLGIAVVERRPRLSYHRAESGIGVAAAALRFVLADPAIRHTTLAQALRDNGYPNVTNNSMHLYIHKSNLYDRANSGHITLSERGIARARELGYLPREGEGEQG